LKNVTVDLDDRMFIGCLRQSSAGLASTVHRRTLNDELAAWLGDLNDPTARWIGAC
jgi:hypothetical protein